MPEIKNTFVKSKMNKDLDARLLPNGEMRDAINVSVSTSESDSVGSLENIPGNLKISDFGFELPVANNMECIGMHNDEANDRIYLFFTNFNDGSTDGSIFSLPGGVDGVNIKRAATHRIVSYNILTGGHDILCGGSFLNFSKSHPIMGCDMIEDYLYWTDNRNQPRKLNVEIALKEGPGYYNNEFKISVPKIAPYNSPSFVSEATGIKRLTLQNRSDQWLPAHVSFPMWGSLTTSTPNDFFLQYDNINFPNDPVQDFNEYLGAPSNANGWKPDVSAGYEIKVENISKSNEWFYLHSLTKNSTQWRMQLKTNKGNQTPTAVPLTWSPNDIISFSIENPYYQEVNPNKDLDDEFLKFSYRYVFEDDTKSLMAPFSQTAFIPKNYGYLLPNDSDNIARSSIVETMKNQVTNIDLVLPLEDYGHNLKEKFHIKGIEILVHDASENSIKVLAELNEKDLKAGPVTGVEVDYAGDTYTNSNGFYIKALASKTGHNAVFKFEVDTQEIVSVEVYENTQISETMRGNGYVPGDIIRVGALDGGSFTEEATIKITETQKFPAAIAAPIGDKPYIFSYSGQNPSKVLSEAEYNRTSDICPIKALTQQVVGNRIVYGNYIEKWDTPKNLDYFVSVSDKLTLEENYPTLENSEARKEYHNHTVKQNRSYKLGIVLMDKFGRHSNVILNTSTTGDVGELVGDTVFHPLTQKTDTLRWLGDSIKIDFKELIDLDKSPTSPGIYSETNPLGWHSYKVVVNQPEQEYYNLYVPGTTSGEAHLNTAKTTSGGSMYQKGRELLKWNNGKEVAQIALFNDNINKIPRDLSQVGPEDNIFSTEKYLTNIVKQDYYYKNVPVGSGDDTYFYDQVSIQSDSFQRVEVSSLKPFVEIGDWATKKGIEMSVIDSTKYDTPTYFYPGNEGEIDPFFLDTSSNPIIATLQTKERIGFYTEPPYAGAELGHQNFDDSSNSTNFRFAKKLNIYEVNPTKTNLDLFFESSTSGRVKELNDEIKISVNQGLPDPPGSVTALSCTHDESEPVGTTICNNFEVLDSQGQPLNSPSAVVTAVRTWTQGSYILGQNPEPLASAYYYIHEVTPATPTTSPIYTLKTNRNFCYRSSSSSRNFVIELDLTDGIRTVTQVINVTLTNVAPSANNLRVGIGDKWGNDNWLGNPVEFDKVFPPQGQLCYGDIEEGSEWLNKTAYYEGYTTFFTNYDVSYPGACIFIGSSALSDLARNSASWNSQIRAVIAYTANVRNGSVDSTLLDREIKVEKISERFRNIIVFWSSEGRVNDGPNISGKTNALSDNIFPDVMGSRDRGYTNQGEGFNIVYRANNGTTAADGQTPGFVNTNYFDVWDSSSNRVADDDGNTLMPAYEPSIIVRSDRLPTCGAGDFSQIRYGTPALYAAAWHFEIKWRLHDANKLTGHKSSVAQILNVFVVQNTTY